MRHFLLVSLLGLLSSFQVFSQTSLHLSKVDIGSPFYRSISKLTMKSRTLDAGTIRVDFLNSFSKEIESKTNIKIRKADYVNCSFGVCSIDFYELPISMEKYTCSVRIKFTSTQGVTLLDQNIKWGECSTFPNIPDAKFLPDFSFSEESYLNDSGEIDLQNLGYHFDNKPLTVWGFLKDNEGKIIWKGAYEKKINASSGDSVTVVFANLPKAWQQQLACESFFVIDPMNSHFEKSKLNNIFKAEFGSCERIPSYSEGDRIDFIPEIIVNNNLVSFLVLNSGRLPFLDRTTKIETNVRLLDKNKKVLWVRKFFTESDLFGFGDSKEITKLTIPETACVIEVEVNPNLIINESSYLNNRVILNICE